MPSVIAVRVLGWWGVAPTSITLRNAIADLHNDVTYEGWGKTSAAGHIECMENSKCILERSISLLHEKKSDRLHVLIIVT